MSSGATKPKNRAAGAEGGTAADERPVSKKSRGHWARDVSAYDILEPIGEGTYGKVGPIVYPTRDVVFLSTNGPDRTVNLFLFWLPSEMRRVRLGFLLSYGQL